MIPRWTLDAVEGVAVHEVPVPDDLVASALRLAEALSLPLGSLFLAAHLRVLAALTGESEVVTGVVGAGGGAPVPVRLTAGSGSWRSLIVESHRVDWEVAASTEPPVETVVAPSGDAADLPEHAVLSVGFAPAGDGLVLRLRHRTEVLDRGSAARIAGYHLSALAQMTADPDAEQSGRSLLSAEELHTQIEGLAGPRRPLPDRRAHQLIAERARLHPDAVAAVHRGRRWTYAELDARANRVARALLRRGLSREGVVAVVTERSLDWMAAVLGILMAGGVYLPVEPRFPAERIATTLSRAGCAFVLTEAGCTASLDRALGSLPGVGRLLVEDACAEEGPDGDPGVEVTPDGLAYIYFTSGSTGEPKGAMCEHAGMLNHLLAKIDDLGIRTGDVVAQTAPQCFDISLWQLISALLVGGTTLVVDQEVILDARRFVDTIADGRVAVLQVVPSYLDVVLSFLEQSPRELPDLRCVSVTGEALKHELVRRFFAILPQVRLVNAYGLTETSDDTNHEVMVGVPDGDRVPLGRPVNNVHVYVVDEHLSPVPLGAPGEIVFSGICVGRGYVNDPVRTAASFVTDPHRPGHRLYRSGDHGRWLPDGRLEFLGRRDGQVKISGFRIEIGEVENTLVRVPGVRDGAVVVAQRPDGSRHLVAFYGGPRPFDEQVLSARLRESLPEYMIPSAFHWRESLPLTANSKIDRRTLAALAAEVEAPGDDREAPATPTERRLAAAWSGVLGIPEDRIDRRDHFFDLGGTSLSAVRLAIAMERAVSIQDVTRHPILADLAALVDARSGVAHPPDPPAAHRPATERSSR